MRKVTVCHKHVKTRVRKRPVLPQAKLGEGPEGQGLSLTHVRCQGGAWNKRERDVSIRAPSQHAVVWKKYWIRLAA
jgi:hypothetical protein